MQRTSFGLTTKNNAE